ncbi:MAG: hypothetical protein ACR2KT_00425 [Methylocella sp.]
MMAVVRLLAFGEPDSPPDIEQLLEILYRTQAAKVLFGAASRGEVRFFGTCLKTGIRGLIPPEIFDVSNSLVNDDDTGIGPDLNDIATSDDAASYKRFRELMKDDKIERWRDVMVERASLGKWIGGLPKRKPSDDEARAAIRVAIDQNDGFIGQEAGAIIVRERYPGFNKKRAMALVKELTCNDIPGPKRRRKNRAANRA